MANTIILKISFPICVILGAVGICLGYYYSNLIVSISSPLILMTVYLVVGAFIERTHKYYDSYYYMGFLFTLISMATSLCFLRTNDKGELISFEPLLFGFGLALATTIYGMLVRIVGTELSSSSSEKEGYGKKEKSLEENFKESVESINGTLMNIQIELNTIETASLHNLKTLVNNFAGQVESCKNILQSTFESVTVNFKNKLEEVTIPPKILDEGMTDYFKSLKNTSEEINKAVVHKNNIIENYTNNMKSIHDIIGVKSEPIQDLNKKMETFLTNFKTDSDSIVKKMEDLKMLQSNLESNQVEIFKTVDKLHQELDS